MEIKDFLEAEAMKYWSPPKGNTIIKDILDNPTKYPNYTFTPKVDGEWNKMIWDGEHVYMLSRSRNVENVFPDRAEKVPHLVAEIKAHFPKNTVLLGELCFNDLSKTSKDVGSIMRSLAPRAIKLQETNPLYFVVFDCLMWDGVDLSGKVYEERFLSNIALDDFFATTELVYTACMQPYPMEDLNIFLDDYFGKGGEGVVLTDKKSFYVFGGRPARATVKIKKSVDEFEAQVVGFVEPNKVYDGKELDTWEYFEGNIPVTKPYYNGWKVGVVVKYKDLTFSVASGLTDVDREWLASKEAADFVKAGKLYAVCGAMEFTAESARHPYLVRLRTDVK